MVEYRDNGEPIPDGRITVEIAWELAVYWSDSVEPKQSFVYEFKDINFLRETDYYLVIIFPRDRGPRANTQLKIPWCNILSVQVNGNSEEYVRAMKEFDPKPQDFYDTRKGGTCIGCASRS